LRGTTPPRRAPPVTVEGAIGDLVDSVAGRADAPAEPTLPEPTPGFPPPPAPGTSAEPATAVVDLPPA